MITLDDGPVVDFGGLSVRYDARVLTPRAWTVAQSEWVAELMADAPDGPLLELCAGAGHIGLLAVASTGRALVQVDIDPVACAFATHNAATAGVEVDVREGPMDEMVAPDERFPVILADPPWVPTAEITAFPEDPVGAIDGGGDGLALARHCLRLVAHHLADGGSAVVQLGPGQDGRLAADLAAYPELTLVETRRYDRGVLLRIDRRA